MKILGIHDGHNAAAALLEDGRITFALEEERLTRIKNHSAFPSQAIRFLLAYTGTKPGDIDQFAFSSHHIPAYKNRQELMDEYRHANSPATCIRRMAKVKPVYEAVVGRRTCARRAMALSEGFREEQLVMLDHHHSHAAAAYYGSPWWPDGRVLVLTNDGGGDGLCATVSIGENGVLRRLAEVPVGESVGYLYSMVTFLLGMVPEEHEYKLMGMAPYASRNRYSALLGKFEGLIEFCAADGGLTWRRRRGVPHFQYSYRFVKDLVALERFDAVCGALQEFTENMLSRWVTNCIRETGIHRVALSGGVFMNVKANKRILEIPELESLFIFPTCGDPTNSIGAAYQTYVTRCRENGGGKALEPLGDIYFGPEYSDAEIERALQQAGVSYRRSEDIEREVAGLLAQGEVVARFKGRMEFGARALGNRSILADPAKPGVIRIVNDMIKNRDFWMPFAPSVAADRADEYLVNPKRIEAPYMIMSFDSRIEHARIYAASHPYDRTVRPQVVYPEWNPDYYRLIKLFEEFSGTGAVLNTSFNLHGYPIVCAPADALGVLRDSGLRNLAIGSFLVRKKEPDAANPQTQGRSSPAGGHLTPGA